MSNDDAQPLFAGYTCPTCYQWVPAGSNHVCWGPSSTSSGYHCPNCNQYVAFGTWHSCVATSATPVQNCCACCAYMAQINNLMQRVELLLKKLEEKEP